MAARAEENLVPGAGGRTLSHTAGLHGRDFRRGLGVESCCRSGIAESFGRLADFGVGAGFTMSGSRKVLFLKPENCRSD